MNNHLVKLIKKIFKRNKKQDKNQDIPISEPVLAYESQNYENWSRKSQNYEKEVETYSVETHHKDGLLQCIEINDGTQSIKLDLEKWSLNPDMYDDIDPLILEFRDKIDRLHKYETNNLDFKPLSLMTNTDDIEPMEEFRDKIKNNAKFYEHKILETPTLTADEEDYLLKVRKLILEDNEPETRAGKAIKYFENIVEENMVISIINYVNTNNIININNVQLKTIGINIDDQKSWTKIFEKIREKEQKWTVIIGVPMKAVIIKK